MITLCIRYTVDHAKRKEFEAYARSLQAPIRRAGGQPLGYYLPTLLAGATTMALGLIGFADLASYERYRATLAEDAEGRAALAHAERTGCILGEERSFLQPIE
jgi:hypothetical protein